MLGAGSLLLIFSIIAPNVTMFGVVSSWLPFSSILIMLYGILRFVDAFSSAKTSHQIMHMQSGIIDLVCGFIILTHVGEKAMLLHLLVAAYLLIEGLIRIMMTFSLDVLNPNSARIGGGISIILGLLAWMDWPFSGLWFLSFALSAEIANRGWALMLYAYSVNKE